MPSNPRLDADMIRVRGELLHSPVTATVFGRTVEIWANNPTWVLVTYDMTTGKPEHDAVQGPMTFEQAQQLKKECDDYALEIGADTVFAKIVNLSRPMFTPKEEYAGG